MKKNFKSETKDLINMKDIKCKKIGGRKIPLSSDYQSEHYQSENSFLLRIFQFLKALFK